MGDDLNKELDWIKDIEADVIHHPRVGMKFRYASSNLSFLPEGAKNIVYTIDSMDDDCMYISWDGMMRDKGFPFSLERYMKHTKQYNMEVVNENTDE